MTHSAEVHSPDFWENSGDPIAVAHRGGDSAGADKENTLAAFQATYNQGFRWFETDGVPTSDGKLLAIHGRGLQPRPNKDVPPRWKIERMTYDEAEHFLRIGGEPAPLIEELLTTFPDAHFFLDPKTNKAVPALIKVILQHAHELDRFSIGSFSEKRTTAVVEAIKEATGHDVCRSVAPIGAVTLQLAAVRRELVPTAERYVELNHPDSLNIPTKWATARPWLGGNVVQLAHDLGLHVAVWTPNDEEAIENSLERDVDAVMSDRVALLKAIIARHNPNNGSINPDIHT